MAKQIVPKKQDDMWRMSEDVELLVSAGHSIPAIGTYDLFTGADENLIIITLVNGMAFLVRRCTVGFSVTHLSKDVSGRGYSVQEAAYLSLV